MGDFCKFQFHEQIFWTNFVEDKMKNPSLQRAVKPQIKLESSPFFEPSAGGEATNRAKKKI